jgi:hypothetical protein
VARSVAVSQHRSRLFFGEAHRGHVLSRLEQRPVMRPSGQGQRAAAEPAAARERTGPTTTRFQRNPGLPVRETARTNAVASRSNPSRSRHVCVSTTSSFVPPCHWAARACIHQPAGPLCGASSCPQRAGQEVGRRVSHADPSSRGVRNEAPPGRAMHLTTDSWVAAPAAAHSIWPA